MTWHEKGCADSSQRLSGIECLLQRGNLKLLPPAEPLLFSPTCCAVCCQVEVGCQGIYSDFPSMCARQGQATQEGKTTSCLVRDNSPKHLCLFLQPLKRCSSPGHSCGGFWVRGTQAMGVPHVLAAAVVRERWGRARGPRKAWCVSSLSGVTEWHFKDASCSSFP